MDRVLGVRSGNDVIDVTSDSDHCHASATESDHCHASAARIGRMACSNVDVASTHRVITPRADLAIATCVTPCCAQPWRHAKSASHKAKCAVSTRLLALPCCRLPLGVRGLVKDVRCHCLDLLIRQRVLPRRHAVLSVGHLRDAASCSRAVRETFSCSEALPGR